MDFEMSYGVLILLVIVIGFAPFFPQPHIVEKLGMLFDGTLKKPIDIFDLISGSQQNNGCILTSLFLF